VARRRAATGPHGHPHREASEASTGLVGYEVHRAARIAAVGHGGQVLLSSTAAGLVQDALPADVAVRELGAHRLKDLGRPEVLFQLVAHGLRSEFPPIRSLDNPELPNNLPASLSPFVGRGAELAEIRALVLGSRLVTLTGAGSDGRHRRAGAASGGQLLPARLAAQSHPGPERPHHPRQLRARHRRRRQARRPHRPELPQGLTRRHLARAARRRRRAGLPGPIALAAHRGRRGR